MPTSSETSTGAGATTPTTATPADEGSGLAAALLCYGMWGFLPLLFHFLKEVNALTVVADRTLWSLVLVGVILAISGRLGEVRIAFADGRRFVTMLVSAVLLVGNWLLYVWAVETGHVLEASFGYFINPMVNVAIGMVMLGERQNRWQTLAIGIAVIAIFIQAIGIGNIPYISLGLAFSFGIYGYLRKTVAVSSATGLFAETLIVVPLALAYLFYTFIRDGGVGPHADPGLMLLLLATGPATAVPLLLFAYSIRRLRLTTIGMFQYIAPSMQFILAVTFFAEHLNAVRLLSFVLTWVALAIFTADTFARRGSTRARRA